MCPIRGRSWRSWRGCWSLGGRCFCPRSIAPGGRFLLAKLGAEYVLRWLPVGDARLAQVRHSGGVGGFARAAGLRVADILGHLVPDPLRGGWRKLARDVAVNYIVEARRG